MFFFVAALLAATQILPLAPDRLRHATFTTSANAATVRAGAKVSLWIDVVPKPSIHIYGPGAKNYLPVTLTVTPPPQARAAAPVYPKPEVVFFPALNERTPVYSAPFRITQPVTIASDAKPGELLTFSGVVKYQACDDLLCYPPASVVVSWGLRVEP